MMSQYNPKFRKSPLGSTGFKNVIGRKKEKYEDNFVSQEEELLESKPFSQMNDQRHFRSSNQSGLNKEDSFSKKFGARKNIRASNFHSYGNSTEKFRTLLINVNINEIVFGFVNIYFSSQWI